MDREKRRQHQLDRHSKYSELSATEYGRLLYLQNRDKYMRMCMKYGFYPSDEDCEDFCANLMNEVFKSTGRCIYQHVEVELGTWTLLKNRKPIFRVTYARRPK